MCCSFFMVKTQRKQSFFFAIPSTWAIWTALASCFFLITLSRSWVSIKHLPPDPGLEFQILARTDGISEIFNSYNGYPQVIPRLISEFLNLVPLSQLTYWSTVNYALISMVCAVAITKALSELVGTKTAILVGLVLSTAFPAHEGLVGNLWAIRWILLPTTCVIASIPAFSQKHWRLTLILFIATGLSHAYIFIPTVVYLLHMLFKPDFRARTFVLSFTLIALTLFQGFGYINSSRQLQLYGESTVYWPWAGSGIFWWAIFTIPFTFALIAVLPNLKFKIPSPDDFTPQYSLAVQAILISTLSYLQLGVKSSPAVATVTISFAAVVVMYNSYGRATRLEFNSVVRITCTCVLVVLSVRFYFPSYFLTNGVGWPRTVSASLIQCQDSEIRSSKLVIFEIGDLVQSENLSCNAIRTWDTWFYQR
jgi:hypothetical protein